MRNGSIVASAAAIATGLLLSACGDGAAVPGGERAAPGDDITAPGTTLEIGERAVVPFEHKRDKRGVPGTVVEKGTIAITVTGVEKGAPADLPQSGGSTIDERITPYYISFTVENLDGSTLDNARVELHGRLDGGRSTSLAMGFAQGVDKCESKSAPRFFDEPGLSFTSCTIEPSLYGEDVAEVNFTDAPDYEDSPVVWTR